MGSVITRLVGFVEEKYRGLGEAEKVAILQTLLQNSHRVREELAAEVEAYEKKMLEEKPVGK